MQKYQPIHKIPQWPIQCPIPCFKTTIQSHPTKNSFHIVQSYITKTWTKNSKYSHMFSQEKVTFAPKANMKYKESEGMKTNGNLLQVAFIHPTWPFHNIQKAWDFTFIQERATAKFPSQTPNHLPHV